MERRRFKPERRRQPGLRHRTEAFQPSAQDFDQRLLLRPHGWRNVRLAPCLWPYGVELVQALGRNPERSLGSFHVRGAFLLCQRREPFLPGGHCLNLSISQATKPQQCVMEFLGIRRVGPSLTSHSLDGLEIQPAKFRGALRIVPAARHDGLGAALLQRRIVEKRVGPRRQRFEREGRWLGEIAGDDVDGARFKPSQQPFQPFDVHRLVQAVRYGLVGQRMIRHLPLAHEVLGAGDLVREDGRDQVLRLHAHELGRHLPAAAEARQSERNTCHPTPPRREHRRVKHGLDEQRPHAGGMKITGNFDQFKAVRRGQRQHDVVFGCRRLKFEVELPAEALAQSEAPGAVDAAAERGMDHELHAARFVKEALQHDRLLRRQAAEGLGGRSEIFDDLLGGRKRDTDCLGQPAAGRVSGRIALQARGHVCAKARHRG